MSAVYEALARFPRTELCLLPTPLHPLKRLSADLGREIWIKRDDLTGLAGGGNKTRKLEFVVADALARRADTLLTAGAIQSNHTRQTAAAAARIGLNCVLLHNGWAPEPGEDYSRVGNILLSDLLGATLYHDATPRRAGDNGALLALAEYLRDHGRRPYPIPEGASEHPLGGLGYMLCAAEIATQSAHTGVSFDWAVHCTGGSSTQAGLIAGFAAVGAETRVMGIADDGETDEKRQRVLRLAQNALAVAGINGDVSAESVSVRAVDTSPYGVAADETIAAMRRLARNEGVDADPVYEGKAVRGLIELVEEGFFGDDDRILLLHLGGSPAIQAYANKVWEHGLTPLPTEVLDMVT